MAKQSYKKEHYKTRNKHYKKKCKKTTTRRRRIYKKGGALYGTGVGANCYDPNFSIYNTRELQLFPYKT